MRNLVYRARKELQKFFPDKEVQCILSKGNTYAWNPLVECGFDMEEMEELCQLIEKEMDADIAYEQCTHLLQEYREDFLSEFSDQSWVELQKSAYDNLLMRATHHTCSLLMSKERYDDVIRLSDILGFKYYANNHIHEFKLIAYCNTNQYPLALSYYRKLIDIY